MTGGTGDVNPQIYSLSVTPSVADATISTQFPVPVYRFPLKNDRAMVMEILRCQWIVQDLPVQVGQVSMVGILSTSNTSLPIGAASSLAEQFQALQSGNVIDAVSIDGILATAVGFAFASRITDHDKTDSAGHGILVATDNIFLTWATITAASIIPVCCKITYRWKEVGLSEYIGIVQAQQNPA